MARGAKKKPAKSARKSARPARPASKRPAKKAVAKPRKPTPRARASVSHASAPAEAPIQVHEATSDAIPQLIPFDSSSDARRSMTARERALRSLPVVDILDDPHPVGALRRFLDSLKAEATPQQAQIALGAAQLMLQPIAREHRGGREVKEIVDLVLRHWDQFGERRRGFHAQEFMRSALLGIGIDRERIRKLADVLPPHATSELLFALACAHAVARDKVAMLHAVERALEAGTAPAQFRRDADFAVYAADSDLAVLLARAEVPQIPVDVEPHVAGVRGALDKLVSTLREFGEPIELRPAVRLDAILDAERSRKISLPNDYRALLTITNGMTVWDHVFFGAGDYREATPLAVSAQHYLSAQATSGATGIEDCVPIANWGSSAGWLLYDPRGRVRGGNPGYLLRTSSDDHPVEEPLDNLSAVLARIEHLAREILGTN